MNSLLRSLAVFSALALPLIAHGSGITYTGTASLTDLTNSGNITAAFSNPAGSFSFTSPGQATSFLNPFDDAFTVAANGTSPNTSYTDEIQLNVVFTAPGTGSGSISGDATLSGHYTRRAGDSTGGSITWDSVGDTINLSNGSQVDIFVPNFLGLIAYDTTLSPCGAKACGSSDLYMTVIDNDSPATTPEPSSLVLLGTGVLGAAGMLRRRFAL